MAKIAIVNSSQMVKYDRMDAGFFVMLDGMKEDVARLEKQFDRQTLICLTGKLRYGGSKVNNERK